MFKQAALQQAENPHLTLHGCRGIHVIKGILLQINLIQTLRAVKGEEILQGDTFFTGHLHHLLNIFTLSQQLLHLLHIINPLGIQIFTVPVTQLIQITGPGDQRINRRVSTLVGAIGTQTQEGLHGTQR